MSDKKNDTKTAGGNMETPPETMKSIPERTSVFDLDVSAEVVTVPPPALAGTDNPKIPPPPPAPREKATSQPVLTKTPEPVPTTTKRTPTLKEEEDDRPSFFEVFDVEKHEAKHAQPEAAPEKPADKAAQRGSRPDPREISRSRKLVDEDLFNLSNSLFNNQSLTPLVAPDVSALGVSGLGKDLTTAPKPVEPAAGKTDAASNGGSLLLAAPPVTAPPAPATKSSMDAIDLDVDVAAAGGKLDRKRLGIGVVVVAALAGLVFFAVQRASTTTEESTAAVGIESTTSPSPGNDTVPALQTASTNQAPTPTTNTPAAKAGTEASPDKRAASSTEAAAKGDGRDKPAAGGDKPQEKTPETKPAEAATGNKAQDLAAAMAAANNKSAAPEAPSGGGNEFNRGAASSALGAAAGRAAGCRAPTDPSGTARVSVTFAPSGRATKAQVNGPPFAGTPTGGCIAAAFRSASVPPFSGDPVTVSKSVTIR
ncbi:hypothetical protein [Polyangium jinanense]|uniref:Uncharacterized protein n=1 Tax=Polyangium jinanense TaxID=2829994 RepID=A0A9X4AVK7_9BACT|nr:hypothetical protein [Polyangium jinanense]MDC3960063.1 hypothetical protein [Polyangium jinanense]MDC3984380.1 hypothetical protein [Polyangium jinanense]